MILTDPLLIEIQELGAIEIAKKLGSMLALLPLSSLAVTRQVVADKMVEAFVKARGPAPSKVLYDYLN